MIDLAQHREVFYRQRVALLDIDGVIADERHRQSYALARDWGTYFGLMTKDTVWRQGRELYENCTITGWTVAYLTGRREDTRSWTQRWLQYHGFDHTAPLLMRPQEERAPLANLKAAVVADVRKIADDVILYDDDPEVIALVSTVPQVTAKHCTWHVKPKRMVKQAQA